MPCYIYLAVKYFYQKKVKILIDINIILCYNVITIRKRGIEYDKIIKANGRVQ